MEGNYREGPRLFQLADGARSLQRVPPRTTRGGEPKSLEADRLQATIESTRRKGCEIVIVTVLGV
jgi:hypothetical protein